MAWWIHPNLCQSLQPASSALHVDVAEVLSCVIGQALGKKKTKTMRVMSLTNQLLRFAVLRTKQAVEAPAALTVGGAALRRSVSA